MKIPLLALTLAVSAAAQGPSDPAPLLQLTRVPNGSKGVRPYQRAAAAIDVIGMASVTGLPETWLMEGHQTFASIEDLDTALRAAPSTGPANEFGEPQADELLGSPRTIIAIYQPRLSYRPGEANRNLPKSRYFRISIYRAKPGTADLAETVASARKQDYDDVNLDRPELAYRVISGAPAGTYLMLAPLTSLRQIDEGMLRLPTYAEPAVDQTSKTEIGREHLLFRIEPRFSYVSADFAGDDSAFWNPQRKPEPERH
jgi:hypothetical protein